MTSYVIICLMFMVIKLIQGSLVVTQDIAVKVVNSTFFVSCYDPDNSSVVVTWIGPRGPLGHHTRPKVQTGSDGTRILFINTTLDDGGKYVCTTSENDRAEFRLTVEAPLEFMDTPTEQKASEGSDVTVRCEVRGGRRTWSYEDNNEINDTRIDIIGDGLLIRNASRRDSKVYICKAVQPNTGTIKDRRIKLTIEHAPTFITPQAKEDHVYGYLNGYANLTCFVEAEPKAKFEWLSSPTKVRKTGNVTESPNQSILQLKLEKLTFGKYKCRASNRWGKAERVIILEEGVKPEPPEFLELRGANSDLLDLGIKGPDMRKLNASDSMRPIGFNVRFKPHKEDGGDWCHREFNVSQDNSYVLRHLNHNTEYEVEAATRNLAGLSEYSNTSIFRTLPSVNDNGFNLEPELVFVLIPVTFLLTSTTFHKL
ncbi:neural cell adhesion molecule 2-like [Coccinella septempunctata]|uniref:neural cell adhesion molecule 2-like n=1 Tax=Coccinella septempunctata TaxID=41139 RepID=UPI001D078B21|nr:neural cell adhesion molecule 2-like [Coccinella septempunctata]